MLQEFVETIAQLSAEKVEAREKAKRPEFLNDPKDPTHYYLLNGGVLEEKDVPAPPRQHVVYDRDSLVRLAQRAKELNQQPALWHDHARIVLVWDDLERRERVDWMFEFTELWQAILAINGKPLKQAEMVRALRFSLADAISAPELLNTVREIRFKKSNEANVVIQQGRESLGRTIEMEVTGADALPEAVTLHGVSIYREVPHPLDLRFGLEIDTAEETFTLKALADVLPTALEMTLAESHRVLTEALRVAGLEVPVYFGQP
ncbi:MAG: hypothetical protein JNG90_19835 [Planctomycetaceae bacterium]|nr:hypothetical protein [Planctomycetaceae bacterium]